MGSDYVQSISRTSHSKERFQPKGQSRIHRIKICARRACVYDKLSLSRQKLPRASIADKTLHKRRRCRSIDDVLKVIGVDNRKIIADKIVIEAVSHDFAGIHVGEGTSFEWIPKYHLLRQINIGPTYIAKVRLTTAAI